MAAGIDERFRALVLVVAFAGLRWAEVIALRRSDLDLNERVIHVTRQFVEVGGQVVAGPPKSAAGVRTVAVPPVLEQHLARFVASERDALVFTGSKGATLRRSNFSPKWGTARDSIGRPELHLHDLRHFASVLAASAGASTRELMVRLGHSSPAAALRYQHATAERDAEIARRMDVLLTGEADTGTPTLRVIRSSWHRPVSSSCHGPRRARWGTATVGR